MRCVSKKWLLLLLVLVLASHVSALSAPFPVANVEIGVVDENGRPVKGADVDASFIRRIQGPEKIDRVRKTSDELGRARVSEAAEERGTIIDVSKPGYYPYSRRIEFEGDNGRFWLPSPVNEKVVLRKIGETVPMYGYYRAFINFPVLDQAVGFDMEVVDLVAPYGKGVHSDIILLLRKTIDSVSGSHAGLTLSFSQPNDDFIQLDKSVNPYSAFIGPREAPADGYKGSIEFKESWGAGYYNQNREPLPYCYILRLRTIVDDQGRVKSAWYGVLRGNFEWSSRYLPTGEVALTYWLNPSGSRNLEFDSSKNLFSDLSIDHLLRSYVPNEKAKKP